MPLDDTLLIGKILGNIYNQVFQRRTAPEGTNPPKKTSIQSDTVALDEKTHQVLMSTAAVYKWGPSSGAKSPETGVSPMLGRWGEGVYTT